VQDVIVRIRTFIAKGKGNVTVPFDALGSYGIHSLFGGLRMASLPLIMLSLPALPLISLSCF
jgi:hypothetical protein